MPSLVSDTRNVECVYSKSQGLETSLDEIALQMPLQWISPGSFFNLPFVYLHSDGVRIKTARITR